MSKGFRDVDSYIASAPAVSRDKLMELRRIVKKVAPQAEEIVSYDMPYYKYHGPLVGFAAYKRHVSLFGAIPDELKADLKGYKTGRGSVQFPLNKPLPVSLVTKIIEAHLKMNEMRA